MSGTPEAQCDERLSEAAVIYYRSATPTCPRPAPDAVRVAFGDDGERLVNEIEAIEKAMFIAAREWMNVDPYPAACRLTDQFVAQKYPQLSTAAVDAFGWMWSFSMK